jgi:hypothetical protein
MMDGCVLKDRSPVPNVSPSQPVIEGLQGRGIPLAETSTLARAGEERGSAETAALDY